MQILVFFDPLFHFVKVLIVLYSAENLQDITLAIRQENMTFLHHPNVVLCKCDRDHGTCEPEATAPYLSPKITEGGCQCELGYIGERCESKYQPCG